MTIVVIIVALLMGLVLAVFFIRRSSRSKGSVSEIKIQVANPAYVDAVNARAQMKSQTNGSGEVYGVPVVPGAHITQESYSVFQDPGNNVASATVVSANNVAYVVPMESAVVVRSGGGNYQVPLQQVDNSIYQAPNTLTVTELDSDQYVAPINVQDPAHEAPHTRLESDATLGSDGMNYELPMLSTGDAGVYDSPVTPTAPTPTTIMKMDSDLYVAPANDEDHDNHRTQATNV